MVDKGYDLPKLEITPIILKSQADIGSLFPELAETLTERREARKLSLDDRAQKTIELIETSTDDQWLIWVNYNDEGEKLRKMIPNSSEVSGSDKPEDKVERFINFSNGKLPILITKPKIAGFGMNWQRCHKMIFMGISDSFEQFYQAIRRCYRFGQEKEVKVYIVLSEKEMNVLENIQLKQHKHEHMIENMRETMKDFLIEELNGLEYKNTEYEPQEDMILPF